MMGLSVLLLACGKEADEVVPILCDHPGELRWEADPVAEDFGPYGVGQTVDSSAIALYESSEGMKLAYTTPTGDIRILDLESSKVFIFPHNLPGVSTFLTADLDQDGEPDLVAGGGGAVIFWSDGTVEPFTLMPSIREFNARDLDLDGDLDLLVSFSVPTEDQMAPVLFLNEGNHQWKEVGPLVSPAAGWGKVFDVALQEIDGLEGPDLYLCNDMGNFIAPNAFFSWTDGEFLPAMSPLGLNIATECMGQAWVDRDGDGDEDLLMGDDDRLWVVENLGELGFVDVTATLGLPELVTGEQMSWGMGTADVDNDGRPDLVTPTSWFRDALDVTPQPVWLFLQEEDGTYGEPLADRGLPELAHARSVVAHDINRDGVLDLIFGDGNRSPWVLRSQSCTAPDWLEVVAPEGTWVTVTTARGAYRRLATQDSSFQASQPAMVHIGLGENASIQKVCLEYGNRDETCLTDVLPRTRISWQPE